MAPSVFVLAVAVALAAAWLPLHIQVPMAAGPATKVTDAVLQIYPGQLDRNYTRFDEFYTGMYVGAHTVPEDVTAHVIIFVLAAVLFMSDVGLFVAWLLPLALGALTTRLWIGVPFGGAEFIFVNVLALLIANRYNVLTKFIVINALWVGSDVGSHVVYGHNGLDAYGFGLTYYSWSLWGQATLATNVVLQAAGFPAIDPAVIIAQGTAMLGDKL